ncbi:hypothetical protein LCGC14_2720720 [marine sediment metagenome]|uniref:Uncharacterized protein n=1 Tax=marine sediment metagenome TaxID=412755 RepID=A0A0F9C1W2_9ZZZZ
MKIHWNSLLAKIILPRKFIAITLGKHVCIKRKPEEFLSDRQRERLLKHEAKHVEQYQQYGFFGFLIRYIKYHRQDGYLHNPFEVEARKAEGA